MKILLFSGSHPRHLYIHKAIVELGYDYHAIVMQREELIPESPIGINSHDTNNFIRHFRERNIVEKKNYGELRVHEVFDKQKVSFVSPNNLNSNSTLEISKDYDADICFIFGPDLIKEPILSNLPEYKINLHLGLSPWYRGSATLFWPFYFLEPQFSGITLHNISEKPDEGAIFHQSTPPMEMGDGIHDVAARAVVNAKDSVKAMLKKFNKIGSLKLINQKTTGRVWRSSDFSPEHLRVIYDLFDNNIVDYYLNEELSKKKPTLIDGFQ